MGNAPRSAEFSLQEIYKKLAAFLDAANSVIQREVNEAAVKVIDNAHAEVHDGNAYMFGYRTPNGAPIANNGNITLLITTGVLPFHCHLVGGVGGDGEFYISEDPNASGGTSVPVFNLDRVSPKGAGLVVVHTPNVVAEGTLFPGEWILGGTGGTAQGAVARSSQELILRPSTKYLARVFNRSGNAQPAFILVGGYEEGLI